MDACLTRRKNRAIFFICLLGILLLLLFHSRVLGSDAPTLQNAITFIEMNQNEDGGWGYWVGHDSYTEPTGLCLLALRYAGRDHGIGKGLNYLERCQLVSNGIGINTDDREGSWMSYAALLAFHAFGASKEEICLREWILNFYDGYNNTPPDVVESMYQEFRYDMSIDGWPWFAHTNSWIEPTSFFVIALTYSGVETTNQRIRSGLQLLMDRTNKSGGWNYGNPFVKHTYLDAYPLPTSIALLAMGVAGYTEEEPVLERAIAFLDRFTGEEMSIASLAWTLLAFNHYQTTKEKAETIAIVLKKRQLPDGSFRGNLFETALSFLALSGFNFNTDAIRFRK